MWITAITCICIHSDSTDYQACLHSCVPHTCPRLFFKSICIFVTFLLPWSSSSSRSWQIGSAKRLGGSSRLFWQWPQFISGALPPLSSHSLIYNFTSNEIATKNTEKWGSSCYFVSDIAFIVVFLYLHLDCNETSPNFIDLPSVYSWLLPDVGVRGKI